MVSETAGKHLRQLAATGGYDILVQHCSEPFSIPFATTSWAKYVDLGREHIRPAISELMCDGGEALSEVPASLGLLIENLVARDRDFLAGPRQ